MSDAPRPLESLPRRWTRRALTIPITFALAILFTAALPLLLLLCLPVDLIRGRLGLTRSLLFFGVFLLCESVAIVATFLLWLLHLARRDPAAFERWNRRAQTLWCASLYRAGERLFSLRTHVHGARLPDGPDAPPLLVFVRHESTVDTVLPVMLLASRGYRLRYVLKRELLLDPCLDIVGNRLRNHFVARGGKDTVEDLRGISALGADLGASDALVIYPEGTRFTPAKRARIIARLRASDPDDRLPLAEALRHTLPPLQRGPLRLLEENRGADLLILGHAGLSPAGSLAKLFSGDLIGQEIHMLCLHVPFRDLPRTTAAQRLLLGDRWREVDRFIDEHEGSARAKRAPPRA